MSDSRATSLRDNTEDLLGTLSAALEDAKPPFCSGTLDVNEISHLLYYGNAQGTLGRIDLSKATESELKHLTDTCSPATFGRNDEDVLDPSYRKAGKLDQEHFATKFDVSSSGLPDIVRYGLFEGEQANIDLITELYKLNVYDKGSFFKPHKDTPHGKTMFGSLVVTFPTVHEGGALVLRHGGKEWVLDSGRVLSEQSRNPGTAPIMYAAFFSDVEHEVTPVTSGYRITLTYNLYFGTNPATRMITPQSLKTIPAGAATFKKALADLLKNKTFLPNGGWIGFGLFHQYPTVKSSETIEGLENYLKGRDAMIMQVCKELSLRADLWFYYDEDYLSKDEDRLICKEPVELPHCLYYEEGDGTFSEYAVKEYENAYIAKNYFEHGPKTLPDNILPVAWVKKQSRLNVIETTYATYGNEVSTDCQYADVCLIVRIDPAGYR